MSQSHAADPRPFLHFISAERQRSIADWYEQSSVGRFLFNAIVQHAGHLAPLLRTEMKAVQLHVEPRTPVLTIDDQPSMLMIVTPVTGPRSTEVACHCEIPKDSCDYRFWSFLCKQHDNVHFSAPHHFLLVPHETHFELRYKIRDGLGGCFLERCLIIDSTTLEQWWLFMLG